MYKIIRHYFDFRYPDRTVKTRLTLEEAQAHCEDPETSSSTYTKYAGRKRTHDRGQWFDGYTET